MKRWRFNGDTLEVDRWRYSGPTICAPGGWRRRVMLAKEVGGELWELIYNRYSKTWFLCASGPGFAGPKSKSINTLSTKSQAIADQWRKALESERVSIVDFEEALTRKLSC